ncbi:MAG: hypothetical protein LBS72_00055 [Oscillospiraceae bacterium]|jgi:hypothetical protein|nr:hypothetical protein [Oscillospiraceae bacterium]
MENDKNGTAGSEPTHEYTQACSRCGKMITVESGLPLSTSMARQAATEICGCGARRSGAMGESNGKIYSPEEINRELESICGEQSRQRGFKPLGERAKSVLASLIDVCANCEVSGAHIDVSDGSVNIAAKNDYVEITRRIKRSIKTSVII